ncbi:MAG: heme exporter ATP-binding protein CcmA [Pseudomonadota bacterium]|jgi:heme exporter protein A
MELQVNNLSCARGGVPVLAGVSFAVEAGKALILRGPNGAGKTTLLRTLAGLQPALGGSVSANPDDVALATHADGVKAALTVAENLRFWAAVHGQRDTAPAADAMNLTALQTRPAGQLSAGQRRRLGLARLLVTGRKIWLLDEPTVSLDAASVALFVQVISAHLAAGGLAVIATHIDLGLPDAQTLDLAPFKARLGALP